MSFQERRICQMTFEDELNEAREEGRKEILEKIDVVFTMFRNGKSDEEIFQTERFSSLEEIKKWRDLWKVGKQSDTAP